MNCKSLACITALFSVGLVVAQEPQSSIKKIQSDKALEEVIVTARRRAESLQDTPIAVSYIGADELKNRSIQNIAELTKSIPSFEIKSGGDNNIFMRGIGQQVSPLRVDSSVGFYLDDLYLPRSDGQLLDAVDIRGVQVLRGPQGTLFGKNNTGGAVILNIEKPSFEEGGYISAGYGSYNRRTLKAAYNQPLSDSLAVRGSVNYVKDDGYMELVGDAAHESNASSDDRHSVLLQAAWSGEESSVDAMLFYSKMRERADAFNCEVTNEGSLFSGDDLALMWPGDTDPANRHAYLDNCRVNSRDNVGDLKSMPGANPGFDLDRDALMLGLTFQRRLGESLDFKAVLGAIDGREGPLGRPNDGGPEDFSEVPLPRVSDRESQSLEFQISGESFAGRMQYTAGAFYSAEKNNEPFVLMNTVLGIEPATLAKVGAGSVGVNISEPFDVSLIPADVPLVGPFVGYILLDQEFELDNKTAALYAQVSYDLTENLQLTIGGRYTSEKRSSKLTTLPTDLDAVATILTLHPLFGPEVEGTGLHPYLGPGGWRDDPVRIAHDLFKDKNGDGIADPPMDYDGQTVDTASDYFSKATAMVSLSYQLPDSWLSPGSIDSAMLYGTLSQGFKSGFFEPKGIDGLQRIEPEKVLNTELGGKFEFLDRSLRLNIAAYSMTFKDRQLLQVDLDSANNLAVVFTNAAEAKIEGYEIELMWMLNRNISINFGHSNNRYRYTDFTDLDLFELALRGKQVPLDRTSERFPVAPERTASMGVQYATDNRHGRFTARVDAAYKSDTYYGFDRFAYPAFEQDVERAGDKAYTLFDLRLAWQNPEGDLEVAFYAKNLTDHRYVEIGAASGDATGVFSQTYGRPRWLGLEVTKQF